MAEWAKLAGKLNQLYDELMAAAPDAPDELEEQLVELHAISCRHIAHHLTHLAESEKEGRG